MFDQMILGKAQMILEACRVRRAHLATAESCTGGLIAAALTEIPGASAVFDRGYITYSDRSKQDLLGVASEILESYGAVSADTAAAMAVGAMGQSGAELSIAVTGIAGPDGATPDKPLGLVYFACAHRLGGEVVPVIQLDQYIFAGNRQDVRLQTVSHALSLLESVLCC